MKVVVGTEASSLRNAFIRKFVNKESNWYRDLLSQLKETGGTYYLGYLWDCLIRENLKIVSYTFAFQFLQGHNAFYVFWDNHPKSYFLMIDPNWNYPKNAMLKLCPDDLESVIHRLPEDCYFFDVTYSWVIALTHEESADGNRICYFISK